MDQIQPTESNNMSEIAKLILDKDDWGTIGDSANSLNEIVEEEISFKPITEGLGFNNSVDRVEKLKKHSAIGHKESKFSYVKRPLQNKKEMLSNMSSRALPQKSANTNNDLSLSNELAKTSHLSAFYGEPVVHDRVKPKSKKRKLQAAPVEKRVIAWSIDTIIISLIVLGFISAISTFLQINFSEIMSLENRSFLISFWALFYIIYFTVLDLDRTFGKSLMRMKVVKQKAQVSIIDTFIRTIASLIGLVCFSIPLLFDLHGHLSDTKVIKWK